MPTMLSTKVTAGGQTTVPRQIREALGIREGERVYWVFDGKSAKLTAEPPIPNEVSSDDDFWQGIEVALQDVESGRVSSARGLSDDIRAKYGL